MKKYTLNINGNKCLAAQSLWKRFHTKRQHWKKCMQDFREEVTEEVTELYEVRNYD